MERVTEVFVELDAKSQLVGRLWSRSPKGRESASFEYDKEWLASDVRFALEPLLTIDKGIHHSQPGKPLFGAIGDSAPDRSCLNAARGTQECRTRKENSQNTLRN